ncbi:hypothetical protein [Pseudalkalibacillus hwajinpoensis]|uniref:Uncharacterized protein n=1 Tax=Guptibacillus hwajinpoensis TaxID=208199 RepID=A0A4U1MES9_9BACL|nr:hypothetical protein [Pseudalkalibacillus hwajinpoensis]TKD69191.1 hypothetical protein FBF83_14400 [Pseudalkalibacillus hwajinpoensis]
MDEKLKNLRVRMTDTKAVTFDHRHKNRVRTSLKNNAPTKQGFLKVIQERFPAFLTYIVLLVMLSGTGLFASIEMGILSHESKTAEMKQQVTPSKEELYTNISQSLESIDSENDREQVRAFTESYLTNFDNWRISDMNADYKNHNAILAQGRITEGFFDKTTFSIWLEPDTGLPLEFVIRNQESSVLEEFQLSRDTVAKSYKQK